MSQLEKHLDAYAVIATDGTITTVGHRYKRIPWPDDGSKKGRLAGASRHPERGAVGFQYTEHKPT